MLSSCMRSTGEVLWKGLENCASLPRIPLPGAGSLLWEGDQQMLLAGAGVQRAGGKVPIAPASGQHRSPVSPHHFYSCHMEDSGEFGVQWEGNADSAPLFLAAGALYSSTGSFNITNLLWGLFTFCVYRASWLIDILLCCVWILELSFRQ